MTIHTMRLGLGLLFLVLAALIFGRRWLFPQLDARFFSELGPASADLGLRQPDLEQPVVVEVRDLTGADPDRRAVIEDAVAQRGAVDRCALPEERFAHLIASGLIGDPTPLTTGSGMHAKKNS